jgi:hypothetical protein
MQVLVRVRVQGDCQVYTFGIRVPLERERERENPLTCSYRNLPYNFVVGSKEVSKGEH